MHAVWLCREGVGAIVAREHRCREPGEERRSDKGAEDDRDPERDRLRAAGWWHRGTGELLFLCPRRHECGLALVRWHLARELVRWKLLALLAHLARGRFVARLLALALILRVIGNGGDGTPVVERRAAR